MSNFENIRTSRLVNIMESGKRNLDDETLELSRRVRNNDTGLEWAFGANDKIVFVPAETYQELRRRYDGYALRSALNDFAVERRSAYKVIDA